MGDRIRGAREQNHHRRAQEALSTIGAIDNHTGADLLDQLRGLYESGFAYPNNVCSIWRIMKYLTAKVNTPYAPRGAPGTVLSGQKWPPYYGSNDDPVGCGILMEDEVIAFEEAMKKAARLLGCSEQDAHDNSETLANYEGFRVWVPARGGGVVLIDMNGDYLYVDSGVSPDVAVREFIEGKRTP
jgi:hypothetical protein